MYRVPQQKTMAQEESVGDSRMDSNEGKGEDTQSMGHRGKGKGMKESVRKEEKKER